MSRFTLEGAKAFSKEGRIVEWVHAFLRGPGDNRLLSVGLEKARRFWVGPVELPVHWLDRSGGPEPEMEYREHGDAWARRVSSIMDALAAGVDLPPVIAEYRDGRLSVRDGNHRLDALRQAGAGHAWTLIWYNSRRDFQQHRRELLDAGVLQSPDGSAS